jgi:extracellular elastinolytic metalloproteinase
MKASMKKILNALIMCALPWMMLAQTQTSLDVAMRYLEQEAKAWGITKADFADMAVSDNYVSEHNGVEHLYLIQRHKGIEVYNAIANFNIRQGKVLHAGNRLIPQLAAKVNHTDPVLSAEQALWRALAHLKLPPAEKLQILNRVSDRQMTFAGGSYSREPIPVKLRYQPMPDGQVRLAWDMAIDAVNSLDYWSLRVDALTGKVIDQFSWTLHCSIDHVHHEDGCHTHQPLQHRPLQPVQDVRAAKLKANAAASGSYLVFPVPVESPFHGQRSMQVSPHDPIASPFGWHNTTGQGGPVLNITRGNNVHAFEARNGNTTSNGNEPNGGPDLNFGFPLDINSEPETYTQAATVNLFYMINMLHDVSYRYGFTEVAGNFQTNNFGKGGQQGDEVRGMAQFAGATLTSLNNATFSTPPDGGRGSMRMFLWDRTSSGANKYLRIDSPEEVEGEYPTSLAGFGPQITASNPISGEVEIVNSGGSFPSQGCTTPNNDLTGKIALIDRGNCEFGRKIVNAQQMGAIGVIICNFEDALLGGGMGAGAVGNQATIPAVFISSGDCQKIRVHAGSGLVATLVAPADPEGPDYFDGTLDNGIVAHEFAHGVSIRLTGGPSSAGCLGGDEQMGEGWSDFFTLIMAAKEGDFPEQRRGIGTFVRREANTGRGIRSFPYSTDFGVNPFTYNDIKSESVPHGVGAVWCSMLWDLYWAMADQYGYDPDFTNPDAGNNKAIQLVMDGMKLQPCNPGFIDGRDAILMADEFNFGGENQCLIWEVFARRGLGVNADQGSVQSRLDGVEDFEAPDCRPGLKVRKSVEPIINAGENIEVVITIINDLPNTVTGVFVRDIIPPHTTVVAGSGGFNMSQTGDEVVFTVGNINAGATTVVSYALATPVDKGSDLLFFDPCEVNNPDIWLQEITAGAAQDFWEVQDLIVYNGSYAWGVNNADTTLRSNLIMINPVLLEGEQPVLRFKNWYDTEYRSDGGFVEISTDYGDTWTIIPKEEIFRGSYLDVRMQFSTFAIPNLHAWTGNSGGWIDSYVDLSPFKGEEIMVRYQFGCDGNTRETGWFVDDFTIMDMYNYHTEACVSYEQGADICVEAPGRGTVVEHSTKTTSTSRPELEGILVFPNPARGTLFVAIDRQAPQDINLSLHSLDGRLTWQQVYQQVDRQTVMVPLQHLTAGIYLLHIQSADGYHVEKIIVQP